MKAAVEAKTRGETPVGVDKMQESQKGGTYKKYQDFKYATPEERERIATENDSTPEKYEKSLSLLASLRGETPKEE